MSMAVAVEGRRGPNPRTTRRKDGAAGDPDR